MEYPRNRLQHYEFSLGRDVVGELAATCRKQDYPFCPYYALHNDSQNHPDWTPQVYPETGAPDYTAGQSREILPDITLPRIKHLILTAILPMLKPN